ncbi:signal recognition particle-docking protein FtsY [Corynebacterium suranareeae]|nr:signal recognition particle-docking protein FtsY [Corynebacterium suranareeae]
MDATFWIIGLVVLVVLAIIILLIVGNQRAKSKTVSFEKPEEEKKELTQQEKSGNYQAQGGFNFAPAKQAEEPVLRDGQDLNKPQAEAAPVVPPVVIPPAVAEEEKAPEQSTDAFAAQENVEEAPEVPETPEAPEVPDTPEVPTTPVDPETPANPEPESSEEVVETPKVQEPEVTEAPVEATAPESEISPEVEEVAVEPVAEPVAEPIVEPEVEPEAEPEEVAEAIEAAEAAQVAVESAEAALEETPVPDVEPEPAPEPLDEIAPAAGRIGKLRGRLSRSQNVFGKSVLGILSAGDLDEDAWEDIEAMLIKADLGAKVTARVVDELRDKIAAHGVSSEAEARAMLRASLIDACRPDLDRSIKAMPYEGKPAVVLVVGVNGTGKTTTTGKLARVLVSMGHKVILGAADTFRAAAADQLETWGRRVGAETVRGAEGADPASIAFDAVAKGVERQADVVLVDTAGRLHTSAGLMDQLGKVKRVVEKKAVVDEVLLVLDATVGQNGMQQARIFREVVDITGVVLTKLDGTAKGGIVFQVQEELGVPVKLVGLGEGADDLAPFEVEGFVDALLG